MITRTLTAGAVVWFGAATACWGDLPSDTVRLQAFHELGVPLHAAAGDRNVSGRLPGGTMAHAHEEDAATGWVRISANGTNGWITKRYVQEWVVPAPVVPLGEASYVIGTWNLEHFHDGAARGFPENRNGGLTYPTRGQDDYQQIAETITRLDVKVLALQEIFAAETVVDGETDVRSPELERLVELLPGYDYVVGASGHAQHAAILYDQRHVRLNAACETSFAREVVQKKALFDRQPLFGHFTFQRASVDMNDFVMIVVHLASGQHLTQNHDRAMIQLVEEIAEARAAAWCIPHDEHDVVIVGDFNASRFDNRREVIWTQLEAAGWDVLADDGSAYPATRLSGVPLAFRSSQIDYIIVSDGLTGEEITASQADVHVELAPDPDAFRRSQSDHVPVTVRVRVMEDTDDQ